MAICSSCGTQSAHDFKFCPDCGAPAIEELSLGDPLLGRTLGGKYHIVESIGSGSMGRVYLAQHVALKKRVAIKVLHRDLQVADDAISRFLREGIAAGQISHPSVLQIFDFERTEDGYCYLAMEYVSGYDLKEWLRKKAPLDPVHAIELLRQILSALAEAHRHGVVHRDLKPENVMIVESPTVGTSVKVLDFGLSRLVDSRLDLTQATIPGRLMGTPLYMAPEQWRGEPADHRADLYAATLILYEMLVGKQPFSASDLTEVMVKTTQHAPPTLAEAGLTDDVPDGLEDVIIRGLAKSRGERYQSASDMIADLEAVLDGGELAIPVSSRASHGDGGRRRDAASSNPKRARGRRPATEKADDSPRRGLLVSLAVAGVVIVGAGLWWGGVFSGGGAASAASMPLLSQRAPEDLTPEQATYVRGVETARSRLERGDLSTAMTELEGVMDLKERDAEALVVRAAYFRAVQDYDLAFADYREALTERDDYAEAEAGIGWIHFDNSAWESAKERFDKAVAIDPTSMDGVTGQAALLLREGKTTEACARLEPLSGASSQLNLWKGRAQLAKGDSAAARAAFAQAKREAPRLAAPAEGLGDAYVAEAEYGKAESQFADALSRQGRPGDPSSLRVRCKLAEVLVMQGKYASAEDALAPVLAGGSALASAPAVLELAAGIAAQQNKAGEAMGYLERLVATGTEQISDACGVWTLLASMRLEAGDIDGALEACRSAEAAECEVTNALATAWGLALFRSGEHLLAADKFERAAELDPSDRFARYTLGVLYMDYLGEDELALEQFESYVEAGGADPRVAGWVESLGGR